MLNLGMSELLVFAIIAVIVLGPDKLPTAIRSVIKWYRQIKMLINNVQRDIERELEITEIRETMQKEIARFKDIEKNMQAQLDQIQQEVNQQHQELEKAISPEIKAPEDQTKLKNPEQRAAESNAAQAKPCTQAKEVPYLTTETQLVSENPLQKQEQKVVTT
ncbi:MULTISPECIES: Sec-independent protein translocase protein TatB [Acinetobacter]|uniref:Sec-independent protein translocase protein TatB n=1 Tax=Acinetobacter TaxID=469 RepID=UPI0015BE6D96|nr:MULTISPECIES: Sec-independent protein translocase protein TatB [Acinetobacter]MCO8047417.1 Sec-independent protein translocase protein TatB [Acinetobacter towneri]NWK52387.1 twin-arginine translocase subunit TatB [Acinetobacter sp. SwsAc5]